jgi:hypothetical protein
MRFVRNAIPLPADTQIEREAVGDLPVVFEERHEFVLMEVAYFL